MMRELLFLQQLLSSTSGIIWLQVGIGAALQFPFFVFSAVFPATQRYDLANAVGVVTRLVQASGIVIALNLGFGLIGISVAVLGSNLLDYLIKWRVSYRLIPQHERMD